MEIKFTKYQGTGNDFIMINNMKNQISLSSEQVQFLCDRRLGIGADGLILIETDEQHDFYVNYYNSDGTQSFCGNGSRCSVAFSHQSNIFSGNACRFNAIDGIHSGEILESGEVSVSMADVSEIETYNGDLVLNTGSPHYVINCDSLSDIDIQAEARKIRYNERFQERGINVNFVEIQGDQISMRTYERGVEDETLSCGTGVTAVALSLGDKDGMHYTKIETNGGVLSVSFNQKGDQFSNIHLVGEATHVYVGMLVLRK